jgi:hypothetical protein
MVLDFTHHTPIIDPPDISTHSTTILSHRNGPDDSSDWSNRSEARKPAYFDKQLDCFFGTETAEALYTHVKECRMQVAGPGLGIVHRLLISRVVRGI